LEFGIFLGFAFLELGIYLGLASRARPLLKHGYHIARLDAAPCSFYFRDIGEPTCCGVVSHERLRVSRGSAEDPLNLIQVMLAEGGSDFLPSFLRRRLTQKPNL
jgi:hypothetical protein